MLLALLSAGFQSVPPLPTSKLGPFGAASIVGGIVYILGPCGSLQWTLLWGWEFLPLLPQPPLVFSVRGLRFYFTALELWVAQSVSVPSCSFWFICTQVWDRPVHNPLPPGSASRHLARPDPPSADLPQVLSTLLPVSALPTGLDECLSPWLSDFHTAQFSVSSGCFFFFLKFVVLLVVRGGTVCLPTPPSWLEGILSF